MEIVIKGRPGDGKTTLAVFLKRFLKKEGLNARIEDDLDAAEYPESRVTSAVLQRVLVGREITIRTKTRKS